MALSTSININQVVEVAPRHRGTLKWYKNDLVIKKDVNQPAISWENSDIFSNIICYFDSIEKKQMVLPLPNQKFFLLFLTKKQTFWKYSFSIRKIS